MKEKKGICGICSAGCWIVAGYDNEDRIVKVRADNEPGLGIICPMGERSADIIYSEHRVLHPLKRKGTKGTYDFEKISWDDAYGIIVDRLNRIRSESGPEAAAIYTGVGSFERALCDVFQPAGVAISSASSVLFPFGSPNTMGVGALCYVAYGMIAPHVTCGSMLMNMFNDIENSEMIVVWGTNPATDCPAIDMRRIVEARDRGARVVVIDPRKTMTAELTEAQWVPVRPGTDGALALGMCNVIIEHELYDEYFVTNWTHGFEDFARHVQHYRPEVVESITGVPAAVIDDLAQSIACARGVSQLMYTGMEYSPGGVQAIRAALTLWGLAGQLDVPGGRCFAMRGNDFPINRDGHIKNPVKGPHLGQEKFPVYVQYRDEAHASCLPGAVLDGNPYRIRSLIILGGSIVTAWPNPSLWTKALASLDFQVCIDRKLTADAAWADIVLPASTYYEIESYMVYGPMFRIREKMIEPVGESRGDLLILANLAERLGYGELFPQTEEAMLRHVLKGSGFALEDVRSSGGIVSRPTTMMEYRKWQKGSLRPDGKPGFDTPTGKFEIASTVLAEHGYDSLPVYTEPYESPVSRPDLLARYPLVFNSGSRVSTAFHTQHREVEASHGERPEPGVTVNSTDARIRGIEDGDKVRIVTARGSVTMRARVTDYITAGCIDADHGCGSPVGPQAWQECNINELTDIGQYDPISGFPVYKSLLCDIVKMEEGGRVIVGEGYQGAGQSPCHRETIGRGSIYLDHNATTPLAPEVILSMEEATSLFGNPSSIHDAGKNARGIVEKARQRLASALGCTARRIIFTGSGSESNNLAIKGMALARYDRKGHIVTSGIEHPSVAKTCQWLACNGFDVTFLEADRNGIVDPGALERAITERTFLVSIMTANNETGSLQPIRELANIAHRYGAVFHSDGTQALGKVPVHVDDIGVDMFTVSAHKVYGPKGVGALYIRKGIAPKALIDGGGQESGLRSGTPNTVGIAGFGRAVEMIPRFLREMENVAVMRDMLEDGIREIVPKSWMNGHRKMRLPNTLNMTLPGLRGESVVLAMNKQGVYFSSGSACSSGSADPSPALLAMGLSIADAHCSLRFSLGHTTTRDEIATTLGLLHKTIEDSRRMVAFVPCR